MTSSKIPLSFAKLSGAGNDFLLVQVKERFSDLDKNWQKWICSVCDRHNGVGADGVLICGSDAGNAHWMRIFNSDASEAEMCGNGLRCTALYFLALQNQPSSCPFTIQMTKTAHQVRSLSDGSPCVEIAIPDSIKNVTLQAEGRIFEGLLIDTGVPHFVVLINDIVPHRFELAEIPVAKWGGALRNHILWPTWGCPQGVNVTFCQKGDFNELSIRTFERGVEAETQACGTGAAATAWAHGNLKKDGSECTVRFSSQEITLLQLQKGQNKSKLWQSGPAHCAFVGKVLGPKTPFEVITATASR